MEKKQLKFWLQLWDGVWSIPLAMLLFVLLAYFGQYVFGAGVGFYDPAVWQAALLAAGEVVFFN